MQLISGVVISQALYNGMLNTIPHALAILIATIIFPILLPVLPFRMFSVKAGILGIIWSLIVIKYSTIFNFDKQLLVSLGNLLIITSNVSFLGLNFTGSTTFTSLSGVKKETY